MVSMIVVVVAMVVKADITLMRVDGCMCGIVAVVVVKVCFICLYIHL